MAQSIATRSSISGAATLGRAAGVPWYIWCGVLGVTSATIGAHWDISWHRSIGRDTFWTPAHVAIYLCGVLAGISCGYLILSRTFARARSTEAAVTLWGFRGPLGAFIAAWGGIAMLTSAPFDDWWHAAYGLDVKIVSPPHVLLILGNVGVQVGMLILVLGEMNRASGKLRSRLNALFLYTAAMILVILMILTMEYTLRIFMHSAAFYRVVAIAVPTVLAATARASGRKWAATVVAAVYSLFLIGMVWILPLFPAEPKLGPVYQPVKQFIPPEFPLLLIVPAFLLDLFWQRTPTERRWAISALSGVLFVSSFAAVQWPFANFLMSRWARNWVFGTKYFGYYQHPNSALYRNVFVGVELGSQFWIVMAYAVLFAMLGIWLGLVSGEWMRRVKR